MKGCIGCPTHTTYPARSRIKSPFFLAICEYWEICEHWAICEHWPIESDSSVLAAARVRQSGT